MILHLDIKSLLRFRSRFMSLEWLNRLIYGKNSLQKFYVCVWEINSYGLLFRIVRIASNTFKGNEKDIFLTLGLGNAPIKHGRLDTLHCRIPLSVSYELKFKICCCPFILNIAYPTHLLTWIKPLCHAHHNKDECKVVELSAR